MIFNSNNFTKQLILWNKNENFREMPWKNIKNPYNIWLSEVILQQTRVDQGLAYYEKFIRLFPTIQDLANAKEALVFKAWEGLGYYSRCKNLIATANYIANDLGGIFPETYSGLLALKGIGPYTAAAIGSFAFGLPIAVVDGNVQRVLSRYFAIDIPVDSTEGKKYFNELANELIDKKQPAVFNQAIMDFGATVCKPKLPECHHCPLQKNCLAFNQSKVYDFPIKSKKLKIVDIPINYLVFVQNEKFAVRKRPENGIWRNLTEFFAIEESIPINEKSLKKYISELLKSNHFKIEKDTIFLDQKLTHRVMKCSFTVVHVSGEQIKISGMQWKSKNQIEKMAFPKIINQFWQLKFNSERK